MKTQRTFLKLIVVAALAFLMGITPSADCQVLNQADKTGLYSSGPLGSIIAGISDLVDIVKMSKNGKPEPKKLDDNKILYMKIRAACKIKPTGCGRILLIDSNASEKIVRETMAKKDDPKVIVIYHDPKNPEKNLPGLPPHPSFKKIEPIKVQPGTKAELKAPAKTAGAPVPELSKPDAPEANLEAAAPQSSPKSSMEGKAASQHPADKKPSASQPEQPLKENHIKETPERHG